MKTGRNLQEVLVELNRQNKAKQDIQMPNMNGYTAAEHIRAMPDSTKAGTPIIAMTANAFDDDKKAAFQAGMNGHISKPIEFDSMMKMIRKFIGHGGE